MLDAVSFEDIIEPREQTQRLSIKCAQARQDVFASPGFSVQNKTRGRKKPHSQFKSVKGGPV